MIKIYIVDLIAYSEIRNHYLFLRLISTSTNRGECLSPKDCESAMKFKPIAIVRAPWNLDSKQLKHKLFNVMIYQPYYE